MVNEAAPVVSQRPVGDIWTIAEVDGGTGGLEVGPDGAIYSSDFGGSLSKGPVGTKVFRITPAGAVSVFASGLRGASGNMLDTAGNFLQSNIAGNTVTLIRPDGRRQEIARQLANPVGITSGPDDAFYVANCGNHTIQRITIEGTSEVFSRDPLLRCPNGIVFAPDGHFYISNFFNGDVVRVRRDGTADVLVTLPGGNNGHLIFGNGVLYVAARKAHQLFEVTLAGESRLLAGSGARGHTDGPSLAATLSLPNDLALSPDGATLYFNEVKPLDDPTNQVLTPTLVRALRLR